MEDPSNRSRLAKLLMFQSSAGTDLTNLTDYVSRMKNKQEHIYYIAGSNRKEVEKSPFVERLLARGFEVLYLTDAVDEYSISALPDFDGKKFQNVAKEGFQLSESEKTKEKFNDLQSKFEPLTKWLGETGLKDKIANAKVSERLHKSPCALVAGMFGWTGNMERLALSNAHQKSDDPQRSYYLNQRKTFEVNPFHPLIRELLRRVESDSEDEQAKEIATMLFQTATLRSGYMLQETSSFAENIEKLIKTSLDLPDDEEQLAQQFFAEADEDDEAEKDNETDSLNNEEDDEIDADDHDEL